MSKKPTTFQRKTFLAGVAAASLIRPSRAVADVPSPNVAFIPFDPDAVVVYARDRGYFKGAGIDPNLSPVLAPGVVPAGLLSGSLDLGTMSIGTLAAAHLRGVPFLLVAPSAAITDASRDDGIFVTADSPIRSAADLNGKVVGTFSLQSMSDAVFLQWVEQNGGDPSSVKFIETPLPEAVATLQAHRVDAIFLAEPYISMNQGKLRIIGHYWQALARPSLSLGYCATESWLSKNAETAMKFNQAVCKAAAWANDHHSDTAPIVAAMAKMDPTIAQHMTRSVYGTSLSPAMLQPGIDAMVKYHFLEHSIDASELIWRGASKPA